MNYSINLALLPIVFLTMAACSVLNTPETTAEPVASPTPTAAEILQSAFDQIDAVNSLHFQAIGQFTVKQKGVSLDIPFTFDGDMVLPDKIRADFTFSVLGFTVESRVIKINNKVYIKDPATDEWEVSEEPFFGSSALVEPSVLDSLEDIQFIGDEQVEGIDFQRFKAILPPGVDEDLAGYSKWEFWVKYDDTQLTRFSFKGEMRGTSDETNIRDFANPFGFAENFEDGKGDIVALMEATVSFSDFDENVVIFAPTVSASPR